MIVGRTDERHWRRNLFHIFCKMSKHSERHAYKAHTTSALSRSYACKLYIIIVPNQKQTVICALYGISVVSVFFFIRVPLPPAVRYTPR